MKRVGGLTSFAENLADAAYGRFFKAEPRAFARTLSFQAPVGATDELGEWYEAAVLAKIIELSDRAEQTPDKEDLQLSLCWAPYEYIRTQGDES